MKDFVFFLFKLSASNFLNLSMTANDIKVLCLEEVERRGESLEGNLLFSSIYSLGKMGINSPYVTSLCNKAIKTYMDKDNLKAFIHCMIFASSNQVLNEKELKDCCLYLESVIHNGNHKELNQNVVRMLNKLVTQFYFSGFLKKSLIVNLVKILKRLNLLEDATTCKLFCIVHSVEEGDIGFLEAVITKNEFIKRMSLKSRSSRYDKEIPAGYMHKLVVKYLQKAGYETKEEFDIGFHSIDIYIPILKLFIEIDGGFHRLETIDEALESEPETLGTLMTQIRNDIIMSSPKSQGHRLLVLQTSQYMDKFDDCLSRLEEAIQSCQKDSSNS